MMRLIYSAVLVLFLISCGNDKKNSTTNTGQPTAAVKQIVQPKLAPENGLIERVNCKVDSTVSYALYFPKGIDTIKAFPLMVFCDPQGRGLLPIKKYVSLADKYGFVFAGSYDSKNGNTQERGMQLVEFILKDVKEKASIDNKRIYLCGFSGGARVAAAEALIRGGITGVIGCGAGFPALEKFPTNVFRYISIVGNEDFNYSELYELDKDLDRTDISHQLLVFDGEHDWSPVDIMDEAILLQQLYSMQDGLLTSSDSLINAYYKKCSGEFESFNKSGNYYFAYLSLKKASGALNKLVHKSDLPSIKEFSSSKKVKRAIYEVEDYFKAEKGLQKGFLNSIVVKDIDWCKQQVGKMRANIKTRPVSEAKLLKRVLNYLSLAAFMNTSQLLQQKQLEEAQHCWDIYQLIDPENPDVYYLSALINVQLNNQNEVLTQLKKASDLGYADLSKLESEVGFKFIRDTPEYKKVKSRVEENRKKEYS